MAKRALALLLVFATLLFTGCENSIGNEKVKIVTTFFPIYDFAREVAGDKAEVQMLFTTGVEPHSYEPTISDIALIDKSDLLVYVGGESDVFLENIETKNEVLKLSKVANTYLQKDIAANIGDGKVHESHEHKESGNFDEHIWLSPKNAKKIVNGITEKLALIDEENAEFYKNNASAYILKLDKLSKDLESINGQKEIVIADRFPFGYILHDYKLNFISAIDGCSSDSEPTVSTMKFLIDTINTEKIDTVFTIEGSTKTIAKRLQKECGVNIKMLYSMQTISKNDLENNENYLSLMQKNIELIKEVAK